MPDGKVPADFIGRTPPPGLRVEGLKPEHGEWYLGFGDFDVDRDGRFWVSSRGLIRGEDFLARDPYMVAIRRTQQGSYSVRLGSNPALRDMIRGTIMDPPAESPWARHDGSTMFSAEVE